ncbi:fimbrial protein [Cupriavidus sp. WS]|uniref:fimbrial protein n=1 Tax=Cupriavidus sp. WS TaxID=1312922 RepID=UPI00068CBCFE
MTTQRHTLKQLARGARRAALAALALAWTAPAAFAAGSPTVTLNFTGTYHAVSCTVAAGATDQTVTLPTISTRVLTAAGETAGATGFHIPVQCDSGVDSVIAYFQSGPTTDPGTGNLQVQDQAGLQSATRVQVQLTNGDGSPIKVGDRSTVSPVPVEGRTNLQIPFFARYFATGQTGAGVVQTYVTYILQMP